MATVDLAFTNVAILGGLAELDSPDALAVTGDGLEGRLNWLGGEFDTQTAIGLFPAALADRVTAVDLVTVAYTESGGPHPSPNPSDPYSSETYPTVNYRWNGDGTNFAGFRMEPLPVGAYAGEVTTPLPADQWKYVIEGWPGQTPGFPGLSPAILIRPGDIAGQDIWVHLDYAAIRVTYDDGPPPEPVFFQSGWVYYDRYDLDQNAYMEDIHVKVMRYLNTLIETGHNGEVLCIGDYDLRKKPFGAGYHLADYLGWPLQVIPSPSDLAISQANITPIFDQIQAGTYIPRIVYVETSSSGPHLTTDQYLILRDLMDAGQTALFLQSEKLGGSGSDSWVESFTGGTMRHHWAPDSNIWVAGGYSEVFGSGKSDRQRVMLETDLTTGKAYLQDLYDQYGINGWGWYEPVGIEYADFRSGFAVLESNEVYTGLTGVPASSPVVTGVLGIPGLLLLGNPPEQIYPRSDGLGTGSADQVYPIPNTYQASPDQWGGYW